MLPHLSVRNRAALYIAAVHNGSLTPDDAVVVLRALLAVVLVTGPRSEQEQSFHLLIYLINRLNPTY